MKHATNKAYFRYLPLAIQILLGMSLTGYLIIYLNIDNTYRLDPVVYSKLNK